MYGRFLVDIEVGQRIVYGFSRKEMELRLEYRSDSLT